MHTRRIAILTTAGVAALLLSACGTERSTASSSAAPVDGTTVIEVSMTDMAFTPNTVDIKAGDTVTLRFRNDGQAVHEAVIGDAAFQEEHAEEMKAMGSDDAMHPSNDDEPELLIVQPGETGELTYTATSAGSLLIGCHQPGHWEAGMKASIEVT